jgi:protease-4
MRHIVLFALFSIIIVNSVTAQSTITPYHERNDFLFTSPGAMMFGLYGYDNPALLSYVRQPDLLITWNDASDPASRWGMFLGLPSVGFGTVHEKISGGTIADYHLSLAAGDRTLSAGISYGWTVTDNPALDQSSLLTLGTLFRPLPFISTGVTYTSALNTKGYEFAGDIAARPLGSELLTLFADYVLHRTPQLDQNKWSIGVALEAMPGIRITARHFDTDAFSLGVQFSLGRVGLETQAHYNGNKNHTYNSYGIRIGAYDRNIFDSYFIRKKVFVEMNQPMHVDYQRYMFFDNTQTLTSLLDALDAAKKDAAVAGIALNTSGMDIDAEKLWELREKLKDLKSSGKESLYFR